MTQYQTGELAKRCNVSIRTIQYYDRKGLLTSTKDEDNGSFQTTKKSVIKIRNKMFTHLHLRH